MCTTYSINRNNNTLLGRTMDLEKYHRYEFKYFKKNYNYEEDAFGKKLYTKYSIMGATFKNYEHLLDGINEKGLMGCTNSYKNVITFPKETKKDMINLTSTKLLNVFLTNCSTIDEIKELSKKIFVVEKSIVDENNFSRHYHYMFTDKKNNSLIMEIEDGYLKINDNPYNIMTNSPNFEKHTENLKKYLENHVLKGSPVTPTKRFLRAYDEIEYIKRENSNTDNIYLMFKSLEKFKILESDCGKNLLKEPRITLYYSVIDNKNKMYYLKFTDSKIVNIFSFDDFKECELKTIKELKK